MPPLHAVTPAALATAALFCSAASGVGVGHSTLSGAGLVGLTALTLVSERWSRRRAVAAAPADDAQAAPTAEIARATS